MGDPGEFAPPPVHMEDDEAEERRGGPAWLPWVVFVILVLIVAWLLWRFMDWGTPDSVPVSKSVQVTALVPSVIGLTAEEAATEITNAGFKPESETVYDTDQPEGVVANQDPAGGTQLIKGGTVYLGVSAGVASATGADDGEADRGNGAPDVIGMSEDLAIKALERSGLKASVSHAYGDAAQGVVFFQSPAPGDPVEAGQTVAITVSLGRRVRQVRMPDVIGLSESQARSRITAAGLTPRPMYQPKLDSVGRVYEQSPAPGTLVDEGRRVFFLLGVAP